MAEGFESLVGEGAGCGAGWEASTFAYCFIAYVWTPTCGRDQSAENMLGEYAGEGSYSHEGRGLVGFAGTGGLLQRLADRVLTMSCSLREQA